MGMGDTFTLSWVCNGQRITTDPIPRDADEATTNVAIADATRKDRRDMLQKLTIAWRILSVAEHALSDAKAIEATRSREEIDITQALREAHKLTCEARVVTMAKVKAACAAEDEVKQIKNSLYGVACGCHTDVVAVAVAKAAKTADVAQVAQEKATEALNEVLALKASLGARVYIGQWANNN